MMAFTQHTLTTIRIRSISALILNSKLGYTKSVFTRGPVVAVYVYNRRDEHDPLRTHVDRLIVYEGDMHNPFIGPNASPRN